MAVLLTLNAIATLVDNLRDDGRKVVAPVLHDTAISLAEIETLDDLPSGWTEHQDGGTYRLERLERAELFGHATTAMPWKKWLYPERTMLARASRDHGSVIIEEPPPDTDPMAFFGIRSCDVHSLGILDRVFLDPIDPTYAARRDGLFVVAATCARPGGTCFCASMNTGPTPTAGFDIALTEICTDERHEFLAVAATQGGQEQLERLNSTEATAADLAAVELIEGEATANMGRSLDPSHPRTAAGRYEHPEWDLVADRCLACANCTMVCPTCFCSTTEDTTNLTGSVTERWRAWDSCFTLGFSFLAGAPLRSSIKSRYRQWLLHKLVTWHDQFGISGCVGCGRCITWCPVGIDLTLEIAAVAYDSGGH
jgi:ferredoxin